MRGTALLPEYMIPAFRLNDSDAPVIEIPGAGHFPTEDTPQTLLALLELFLQTSARPREPDVRPAHPIPFTPTGTAISSRKRRKPTCRHPLQWPL